MSLGTFTDTLEFETNGHCDMIDITERVQNVVTQSKMNTGICTVFVPGSTASIITIEYEKGLLKDFPDAMERIGPEDAVYEHHLRWRDGNGHSHVRASVVGPSLTIPFVDGALTLGTWQQVTLVDFDNKARARTLQLVLIGE
ncbi:YjbQ family protein [Candidatus Thorarchaeota archaeon]|nr:MAG: YjbQ family protein [Candidatus Thorarchaeota archaeon]